MSKALPQLLRLTMEIISGTYLPERHTKRNGPSHQASGMATTDAELLNPQPTNHPLL